MTARLLLPWGGVFMLTGLWQGAAIMVATPSIFPSPRETLSAGFSLLADGYWLDLLATVARAGAGWLISLGLGIPMGLVLGLSRDAHDFSRGVLAFLRSLPAFMLITVPIAMGYGGEATRLATITFAGALIIIDECAESLMSLPPDRMEVVRAYRGGFWYSVSRVLIFEALGRTLVPAARTTIGISFIVTIVAETLVIPTHGVGARLLTSLSGLEMASVYALLLLTGVAGLILNSVVHGFSRRLVFWT